MEKLQTKPLVYAFGHLAFRALFCLLIVIVAGLATWANLDLTGQRASLFMDEMIPFDNVKRILTAESPGSLAAAVLDGGDHRYGRIFYNVSALSAWLPYRLGGDSALIIAIRTTQAALLLTALVWLCLTLLHSWMARTLALLAIACLPYTDYYLTEPKPEPVQLVCYAAFVTFAAGRQFAFGWHWFFLGLAFGTKISAAPLWLVAAILAGAHIQLYRMSWKDAASGGVRATLGFIGGWVVAVPILAVPTVTHLESYLNWTFRATGHPLDDSQVTAFVWLQSMLGGEVVRYAYPPWVGVALLAAIGVILVLGLAQAWRRDIGLRDLLETRPEWLVLGLAAALVLSIMMAAKRLWGFYLYPGQVLAIVGLVAIAEHWMVSNRLPPRWRLASRIAASALTGLIVVACVYSGEAAFRSYERLAHRTRDAEYVTQLAVYRSAVDILSALGREIRSANGTPLDVVYDPFLFLPESTPDVSIQPTWNYVIDWSRRPSAIVLGRTNHLSYFLHEKPLPPATSATFSPLQAAIGQFAAHVEPASPAITAKPYQLVHWFGEDAALILREDVAERWRSSRRTSAP